jgi:zinc and cadmium transporter
MQIWAFAMGSVLAVSALSFAGAAALLWERAKIERSLLFLVSFAVGSLFGAAFLHLLPEAFARLGGGSRTPFLVIAGLLAFFALEKFIRWRHCHVPAEEGHVHPMAVMNLVGDAAHNLVDGVLIGAAYGASVPAGLATTLAVMLHEIPQEIGDLGVLLRGGFPARRALLFNFFSSLAAFAGAAFSLVLGPRIDGYAAAMLPLTAGGFLYVAGSDLIPELHHEVEASRSLVQMAAIVLGVAVMAALLALEG